MPEMKKKVNFVRMTTTEFKNFILQQSSFIPTIDQFSAIEAFIKLMASREPTAMILRGSAGTGKTSIVSVMVRSLLALRQKVVLLAPTGRAAKVLSLNCDYPASTIHRKIYRQKSIGGDFSLDVNMHTDTLFVVDEASMISTIPQLQTDGMPMFKGNGGGVIDDLITYVYSGRNCKMLLVGDTAQLPPVGEEEAPALNNAVIGCYGLKVVDADLNEVVRQAEESGILWNATLVRQLITHDDVTQLPRLYFKAFADIMVLPGNKLIETLEESYASVGIDDTVVITRSNKRANIYNNGIRTRILDYEEELCGGDRIMIVKNHYFNSPEASKPIDDTEKKHLTFIANGDMATVCRARRTREFYGFRFADITLRFPDYDDEEMQLTAVLDTLQSEAPAMTVEQRQQLYDGVMADYADLPRKADRLKAVRDDTYYNALQIKYAYAITCHKAQGGGWSHVYVDQGYMTDDMLTPDYIHWLYTAITRAKDVLYLVNWPDTQVASDTSLTYRLNAGA